MSNSPGLKQAIEQRQHVRAQCRTYADSLALLLAERLEAVPQELMPQVLSMLQSELQSLSRRYTAYASKSGATDD